MNKSKIEWCDYTWNPVTGCLYGCLYCYAKRIAERFAGDVRLNMADERCHGDRGKGLYVLDEPFISRENRALATPFGFTPTLHTYRLDWPGKVKNGANISVCSMADLFGEWVPDEWIQAVFEACEKYPRHNYMFLTRNPKRYGELLKKDILPVANNFWYGTTTPTPDIEFFWHDKLNTFISIEPILASWPNGMVAEMVKKVNWVIVGAQTGPGKNKVRPKREWIMVLIKQCKAAGIPIFLKRGERQKNGTYFMKNLMGENFIQEFPEGLIQRPISDKLKRKLYGKCSICKQEYRKSSMIALLYREKRGAAALKLGYACPECFETMKRYFCFGEGI